MKKFETAEMEVVKFNVEDVITTSLTNGEDSTKDDEL
jgi:hypothetical protein